MKLRRITGGLFLCGMVWMAAACAKGTSDLDGLDTPLPAKTTDPTDPDPPSNKVPPPAADNDAGEQSDASTSTDGGASDASTASDAKVDTGTDAGVVDAGACTKTPPSLVCGLVPQCGCAVNETCDVTNKTTGAVSCVLAGGGPVASLCTTTTQCAKGLTCAYGACRPYCTGVGTACTTGGLCEQNYDPPGTVVPNSTVCSIPCDPRSAAGACGSNTCIWDSGLKVTDCDKTNGKALYAPCNSYNDCGQNLACVNHPLFGFECEKWCNVGSNAGCGLFESCVDVYGANAPVVGGQKLGHCQ